jgi:hypothetical protein
LKKSSEKKIEGKVGHKVVLDGKKVLTKKGIEKLEKKKQNKAKVLLKNKAKDAKKLDAKKVELVKKVTGKKAEDLKKKFKAHKKISKDDKKTKEQKIAKVFGDKK